MKRFFSLLLLACSMFLSASAQEVLYSDYADYDARNSTVAIIGKVNGTLYTFRSVGKGYFLDAFDESMQRKATVVLDFFPEKIYQVRFVPFMDRILVLYQSQSGTVVTQYAAMLDEKGILVKSPTKIDQRRGSFWGSSTNRQFFSSAVSEDRSQVLIYSSNIKGKKIDFQGYWLNPETMKVEKKVKWQYKGRQLLSQEEGILTNQGQFVLPVYTVVGSKSFADEYAFFAIEKNVAGFKKYILDLGGNYIERPFQKMDNSRGQIHFASFYTSSKTGNNEGVAASNFDLSTMRFNQTHFVPFGGNIRGNTAGKKRERALNNFRINQLVVKNDGGFVVVAEEIYVLTQNAFMPGMGFYSFYYSPAMTRFIREFHYNDIMVLSYNNQYEQEWNTFVRKQQYSQEDDGMFASYTMLNTGGGLGFLFNDFNVKRSRIQLSSLNASGGVNIGYLDAGAQDDPDWLPRMGKQIDAKEILVPCLRKKQICFAKIIL